MRKLRMALALLVALALAPAAMAATPGWGTFQGFPVVRLLVDGREVSGDVPAVSFYGRTMVPLRLVSEALGAEVGWDQGSQTASVETRTPFNTWSLTAADATDAFFWARTWKDKDFFLEALPMYLARPDPTVGIGLLTPWGSTVFTAKLVLRAGGTPKEPAEYAEDLGNEIHVILMAATSLPGSPHTSLVLVQDGTAHDPGLVTEQTQFPSSDDGYNFSQEFVFHAEALDRAGSVTVIATVNGQEYTCVWDLATLK